MSRRNNYNNKDPFYVEKGYKYLLFQNFDSNKLSPMCKVINYYVDKLDLSCFEKHNRATKDKGGRPRYSFRVLLKLYLLMTYKGLSLRKVSFETSYGGDISYLLDGDEKCPCKSTISSFLSILDIYIEDIFLQFINIILQELNVNISRVYCDGTVFEAWNNKRMLVTLDRTINSNKRYQTVLFCEESSEEQIRIAKEKLTRNAERMSLLTKLGRSSYGLNDIDSSIMQDKDKSYIAGYNVQYFEEVEYGLIIYGHISNKNPDAFPFIESLDGLTKSHKHIETVVADAGYVTKRVMAELAKRKIQFISVKRDKQSQVEQYSGYRLTENYNEIICPQGELLKSKSKPNRVRDYTSFYCRRRCGKCDNYKFRVDLIKLRLDRLLAETMTEENIMAYKLRANLCESPFGFVKHNMKAKKLNRVGKDKVRTIMFCHIILYNLSRMINIKTKNLSKN
ncbi:MAG: transposase [Lachnospiraceae bacterium]|jgi:transposase|nr:transposase [Lachnospiraceae bacterium]